MNTHQDHVIIAQCTPSGSGALALVRLSGQGAVAVASACAKLSSGKSLVECQTHTISHGYVIDAASNNEIVDEVLFLLMRAPRSFTGEDIVEISCHNNPFIIERIIALACRNGARVAMPGEFSRRALLNGKLDLLQAESLHDVISASSELALKKAMEQLQGSFSQCIMGIEKQLFALLAYIEACFEFLDEEQRDLDLNKSLQAQVQELSSTIGALLEHFNQQKHIKEGIRVALIGSVNAGKSTLFNALVGKDRAIVSSMAGTTRDSIEAGVYKHGVFITYVDTAGLRKTTDSIEQEGIKRSTLEAGLADLILLVFDASSVFDENMSAVYQEIARQWPDKIVWVANKIDQSLSAQAAQIAEKLVCGAQVCHVSGKNKTGLDSLHELIDLKLKHLLQAGNMPYMLNKRQFGVLASINEKLVLVEQILLESSAHELLAYHVREALELISQLTGKNVHEKMLDTIFHDFCIGK
jgi:tRNA modification GTPase